VLADACTAVASIVAVTFGRLGDSTGTQINGELPLLYLKPSVSLQTIDTSFQALF